MGAEVVIVIVTSRVSALVNAVKLRIKCRTEENQPVTVTGHVGPVKRGTAAGNVKVNHTELTPLTREVVREGEVNCPKRAVKIPLPVLVSVASRM